MAGRDAHGHRARVGLLDAVPESDREVTLRLRVRRDVGSFAEVLAERPLAGGHHDQIMLPAQRREVRRLDVADLDGAAAILVFGHQPGQIDAVVEDSGGSQEVAAEDRRAVGHVEVVVVDLVAVLLGGPEVDAHRRLAGDGRRVVRNAVLRSARGHLLGGLVGVDTRGHPGLLQEQGEV